jgi:dsDNA-specific endonuclease/ATPase MutS2
MKYQVGDKILILHSGEEGEVLDIINDKMLLVDVKGVSFPVYMDQVDFPYFKQFTEKKTAPLPKHKKYIDDLKKEKSDPEQKEDGVWLAFLPVMDIDEFGDEVTVELKIHLLNHTKLSYNFSYCLSYFGKKEFELRNKINPFEDFYIHDIPFDNLNDNPVFEIEFNLEKPDKRKADYFETHLKLKPKQIFNKIEELKQTNKATFSYRIFNTYPDKEVDEGSYSLTHRAQKIYDITKARELLEPPRSVVDLHIEKLSDNWRHFSNYEILSLQLKTFEKYYELALAHFQPSLIIIHGVGSGKLRDEIHELLKYKTEVKTFVNQYDPRFGYGATEIFFQY